MQIILLPDTVLSWNNVDLPKVGTLLKYKTQIYRVMSHKGKQARCKLQEVIKLEGK